MYDVTSATKEGHKLRLKFWRGRSKLSEEAGGEGSENEAHDEVLLVKPSLKTEKTGPAPVSRTTVNSKNTPLHSGCNVVAKTLEASMEMRCLWGRRTASGHTTH